MSDEILRGFEIVRDGYRGEKEVVYKALATELAAKQMAADVKWLQMRSPHLNYQMRALVSVPQPTEDRGAANAAQLELPLKTQQEMLAEARVAAGEYDVVEPGE